MKVTRWSPDTCDCIVEYEWDEKIPLEDRTLALSAIKRKCPAHASLSDEAVYAAVSEENPRKNRALGLIANIALPQGSDDEKAHFGMECLWSFGPDRLLKIEVPDLPIQTITLMQDKVTTELGRVNINIKKSELN